MDNLQMWTWKTFKTQTWPQTVVVQHINWIVQCVGYKCTPISIVSKYAFIFSFMNVVNIKNNFHIFSWWTFSHDNIFSLKVWMPLVQFNVDKTPTMNSSYWDLSGEIAYMIGRGLNIVLQRYCTHIVCVSDNKRLLIGADPGVASSIPVRSHTFVEIDHEIISTVILLSSADLFKKGCCQLQAKVCAQTTG